MYTEKTKLKNFEIGGLMTDYIPTDEELEKSFAKLPNKKRHSKRVMERFSSITLFDIMLLVVFCVNFEE